MAVQDTDVSSPAAHDIGTELTALRADVTGLAESVKDLALQSPELAKEGFEAWIRRQPLKATFIAAGVGFVLSLIMVR